MTTRIAKPGGLQTDQKKVYLNWANHHLRKYGMTEEDHLSDLKEISDGIALPRLLKAIVQECIPGIHTAICGEEDRRENIELCVQYLQKAGLNCSTFNYKDLCEGKDRAILSLFYSLSQYKHSPRASQSSLTTPTTLKIATPISLTSNTSGPHTPSKITPPPSKTAPPSSIDPTSSNPLPSRIARPISPGLKLSQGVNGNTTSAVSLPNSSPPKTLLQPVRRTAGSSIVTSTTFDRSFIQRKVPYKPMAIDNGGSADTNHESGKNEMKKVAPEEEEVVEEEANCEENGELKSPGSNEVKSDPESDVQPKRQLSRTRLPKFGSFSHGHAVPGKESRLQKPLASKTTAMTEGGLSVTPQSQSKLRGPVGVAKLQAPTVQKNKDIASPLEDPPEGLPHKESPATRAPSRLKFLGSGGPATTTQSPVHIPLNKRTSGSTNNLNSSGEEATHSESRLRMHRNGSDGAIKRHQVIHTPKVIAPTPALVESGKTSLPRSAPKGTFSFKLLSAEAGEAKKTAGGGGDALVHGEKSKEGRLEDTAREKTPQAGHGIRASSLSSGLRRPATGVKKSSSFLSGTIRTPNLPSGPHSASMEEGRQGGEGEGSGDGGEGGVIRNPTSPSKSSLTSGRQLVQPKSRGESRLAKPSSPSTRHKLLKSLVSPVNQSPPSSTDTRVPSLRGLPFQPLQPATLRGKCAEAGSSSSLDSGEIPMSSGESEDQKKVGTKEKESVRISGKENCRGAEKSCMSSSLSSGLPSSKLKNATPASSHTECVNSLSQLKNEMADLKKGKQQVEMKSKAEEEGLKESQTHLRYGRRISPEGMSHEEIHSGKMEEIHSIKLEESEEKSGGTTDMPSSPSHMSPSQLSPSISKDQLQDVLVDTDDSESASSTDKEGVACVEGGEEEGDQIQCRSSSQEALLFAPDADGGDVVQRARSLSPKSSHRLVPRSVARVRDMEGCVSGEGEIHQLLRSHSSDSTSSENTPPSSSTSLNSRKPLKSSLRQKGSSKCRHSSSSSLSTEANGGSPRQTKVTISPRSSQLVYDPEEACLQRTTPLMRHSNHRPTHLLSPDPSHHTLGVGGGLLGERPMSFASVDSSTTSDSLSPSGSSHTLFPRNVVSPGSMGVVRHSSMHVPMGELMDYRGDPQFLSEPPSSDTMGSTPELIESFENQLTDMKTALSDKERMLNMYEHNMADLSSKMNVLKKSLEEKDNKIRHLEKTTWFDLESHSVIADSRASSVADNHELLSDDSLSDSALDQGKEKKKKKAWKFFRSSKKKDGGSSGGVANMGHISPSLDTESVTSAHLSKSIKRSFSKKKTPDLMSISECSPEVQVREAEVRDAETKSTYTMMDTRSEFGGCGTLWEEDNYVKVYEDLSAGARAEVILISTSTEISTRPSGTDSGYYGDILGRHGIIGGIKWGSDSNTSNVSSNSGNHDSESSEEFILGTLSVPPEISWVNMDDKVEQIFMYYLGIIDPEGLLGLCEESVYCYRVGDERRQIGNALLPSSTPYEALANKLSIRVYIKGVGQQSCDALAYSLMMGKECLQSFMNMLQETHWIVVMGTKGMCKSSLIGGLAQHLSAYLALEGDREAMEDLVMGVVGAEIVQFNLDKEDLAVPLKYFKTDLAKRVKLQLQPPIVVLENIYDCKDLEQLLAAASALSRKPYVIAALSSGTTKGVPLHQLLFHYHIRVISCNPNTDPVAGILTRSLKKQIYQLKAASQLMDGLAEQLINWIPRLLHHLNSFINKFHSNSVNLGPRIFMSCPLSQSNEELEHWFISLWNHFIIPYLMGTVMAGIETYMADPMLDWVDVREWVLCTYPWADSVNFHKLYTLNPDDVGWNHAARPKQNRYIMVKEDKDHDDTRSLLQLDTRSLFHSNIH